MKIPSFSPTKSEIILILILCIGIFLRVWKLESTMIFFADAGRDMLAAVEMNATGHAPLLGIPSSVPRFKQGPLFVWFIALVFNFISKNPLAVGYLVAFFNSAALLFCYWLLKKNVNTTAGLFATFLLAVSPLAVAHSRMPYHITPIISFLLLYLWNLQRLNAEKPKSVFYSALSWALLFQFELALFPLIILIPFTLWRTKNLQKIMLPEFLLGLLIGLLPQIIFDVTNKFAQLGGFILWLLYRFASFFAIGRSHAVSPSQILNAWNIFIHYFSRIFSLDQKMVGVGMFVLLLAASVLAWKKSRKNLFIQEVILSLVLLLLALFIHGSPSEAYFPPIILMSCMVIGIGVSFLPNNLKLISTFGLIILACLNTVAITKNNFFTLPSQSAFNYGPSYQEQVQVMKFIHSQTKGDSYKLRSTDPDSHFETYLDNYRVIGLSLGNEQKPDKLTDQFQRTFFINKKENDLLAYPLAKITFFPNVAVIEIPNIQ